MNRKFLIIALNLIFLLGLLGIVGLLEKHEEWRTFAEEPVNLTLPNGQVERCLTCHQGIEEISPSHPIETFGCVSCHGGNGLALDKERAHEGLRGGRNPAALSVTNESCGQSGCHGDSNGNLYRSPVETVPLSPMATKAGEITEIAFTFLWQKERLSRYSVERITDTSGGTKELLAKRGLATSELQEFVSSGNPLQEKFKQNCLASCHLNTGYSKENPDENYLAGCTACHTPYRKGSTYQGDDPTIDSSEPGHAPYHQLTTEIPYTQCNSCHNQGIHSISKMEFLQRDDVPESAITDPQADRNENYYIPLAQYSLCEIELDCIDCHTRNEVMGDGFLHGNKASAQTIKCYDCHGTTQQEANFEMIKSQKHDAVWASRYFGDEFPELKPGDKVAVTDINEPMINVRREDGQVVLYSKVNGKKYIVPQVKGSNCEQNPQEQNAESCHTCHDISEGIK